MPDTLRGQYHSDGVRRLRLIETGLRNLTAQIEAQSLVASAEHRPGGLQHRHGCERRADALLAIAENSAVLRDLLRAHLGMCVCIDAPGDPISAGCPLHDPRFGTGECP